MEEYLGEARNSYREVANRLFDKCPAGTRLSLAMLLCDVSERDNFHDGGNFFYIDALCIEGNMDYLKEDPKKIRKEI